MIGQPRAPEKETLWGLLGWLASQEKSPQLIEDVARNLLEKDRIDKEVFFIDGHFLPYYGLQVIAKGYYPVRRMSLKGNELYAVTDLQGRPLFFLTESCEIDFRPMIARNAEMLIGLGINRPISNHSRVDSNRQQRWPGRPNSMEVRLVAIKFQKTGKYLGIYTNNTEKPAHEIAYYMLQRWGKSENFFKVSLAWFNKDIKELQKEIDLRKYKLGDRQDKRIEKKLYDLMQCLDFHSRERQVEIFRDCYNDSRDIKQILGMITRRSGLIKLIGDTLVVIIDGIDNTKYRKAADKLCHKLNEKEMTLVGRLKVKLSFHLNKIRNRKFVPVDNACF